MQIWDGSPPEPLLSLPGPNAHTGLATCSSAGRYLDTAHEDTVFEVWVVQYNRRSIRKVPDTFYLLHRPAARKIVSRL